MEQSFFAFGAGSRTCIGKNISLMKITKIVPQLLREFEVALTYRTGSGRRRIRCLYNRKG